MSEQLDELLNEVGNVVQASNAQTVASQALAQEVAGKMGEIDQRANQAFNDVPAAVKSAMKMKFFVNADPNVGSDENNGLSVEAPFATLKAATGKIVDGAYVEIHLAANGFKHEFPALKINSGVMRLLCYSDDSFTVKRLTVQCTGAYPFLISRGGIIELNFIGLYDKVLALSSGRFCENPHIGSFMIGSSDPTYPLIITLESDSVLYPFYSPGYSQETGLCSSAMQNVVFCKSFTGDAGAYTFESLTQISFDSFNYRGPFLSSFYNVAFHCTSLSNSNSTDLGNGVYLFSRGTDIEMEQVS